MSQAFQWILQLVDKSSKPASDAEKAVAGYEKELHKVEEQIERLKRHPLEFKKLQAAKKELRELSGGTKSFAERFEEMGQSIRKVGFVQNLMLGAEALKLGFEVGEKVVDVIADIGADLIKSAAAAERFKVSFEGLLGKEEGDQTLEYIDRVAKSTEATDDELKGLAARLLTVGFDAKELSQVLPASLDIAGFLGGGIEKAEAAAEALAHIKTTGEISKRSLGALGLQWTQVMKELQKETGLGEEGVKLKLESGKFGPQALHAVLQSIANKEGGLLGTQAEKMAGTVYTKWKKLTDLPDQIFQKWADTPGFEKFSKALTKIIDKLNPEGPNGQKIFEALDRASMKLVNLVDKFASTDAIDRFASAIVYALDSLDKLPGVLDKVVTVSEVIATIWAGSKIVGTVSSLVGLFPALGSAAGGAVALIAPLAAPLAAVAAAAGSVYLAIHRISSTAEELGGWHQVAKDLKDWWSGEGPALATDEVNANSPEWKKRKAMGGPAIASQSSRVQAGSVGVNQRANVNISIVAPSGDADQISEALNQSLPGAMQQGFERMAISSGAM